MMFSCPTELLISLSRLPDTNSNGLTTVLL
jgi:hypothetical protein